MTVQIMNVNMVPCVLMASTDTRAIVEKDSMVSDVRNMVSSLVTHLLLLKWDR